MRKKIAGWIPYVISLAIIFYALPLLIRDTGSGMFLMLALIPLLTLACAVVYGIRQGFHIGFTAITVILFVPTIFIFYNASARIYVAVYAVAALAGNLIGAAFCRKKDG